MKDTLKELLAECLQDAKQSKGGLDPNKYPSQVNSTTAEVIIINLRFIFLVYM